MKEVLEYLQEVQARLHGKATMSVQTFDNGAMIASVFDKNDKPHTFHFAEYTDKAEELLKFNKLINEIEQ